MTDIADRPPNAARGQPARELNVVPLTRTTSEAENAPSGLPTGALEIALEYLAIAHGPMTYQQKRDEIAQDIWHVIRIAYRQGFRYGAGIDDGGMFQFPREGRS